MPQGKVGVGSRSRTLNTVEVVSQVRVVGERHSHPSPGELTLQGKEVQDKAEEEVQGKVQEVQGKVEGLYIHRGVEVQDKVEGLVRKDQPTTVEDRLPRARDRQIGRHLIMEAVVLVQRKVLRESSCFPTPLPQERLTLIGRRNGRRMGFVGCCNPAHKRIWEGKG